MRDHKTSLATLSIRSIVLVTKFIFIFYLAKITSPENIGAFGLLQASSIIFTFIAGFQINTYISRRIAGREANIQGLEISQHLTWAFILGLIFSPIGGYILLYIIQDPTISITLVMVVFAFEIILQEIGRYLLIIFKPIAANIFEMIRGVAWIPIFIIWMEVAYKEFSFNSMLIFWISSLFCALLYGLYNLKDLNIRPSLLKLSWLTNSIKSALNNYWIAILNQFQAYGDRFIIGLLLDIRILGFYLIYLNLASSIQIFAQTGAIGIKTPQLIIDARETDKNKFKKNLTRMLMECIVIGALLTLFLNLFIESFLNYLNPEYLDYKNFLLPLCLAYISLVFSQVAQVGLYALKKDIKILKINLFFVFLYLISLIYFTSEYGANGAIISLIFLGTLSGIVKWYTINKII